ncbi:hypothetical protein LJR225_005153 [Phenylobacterium sp. LjRoot225]|uniref:hypothetical protein n=1 Tax=Phenylobacterium sp. LjRoot225 TaxID=3342285 RepID=UPI003ECE96C1
MTGKTETLFSVDDEEALAKAIAREEGRAWEHMPEYSVGLLDAYSRQYVRLKAGRLLRAVEEARISRGDLWEQVARDVQD